MAFAAFPGSVIVESCPLTSLLPPVSVPPAPLLPAETTTTTPLLTSSSTARQSGLWPAAYSSGYQSHPADRFTPWISCIPSALTVRT